MAYWLYILTCADGTLYTGIATDITRRLGEHNGAGKVGSSLPNPRAARGKGARYTASRRPVRLAYAAAFPTRSAAQSAEARTKRLSRQQKLELIATTDPAVLAAALAPPPTATSAPPPTAAPRKRVRKPSTCIPAPLPV